MFSKLSFNEIYMEPQGLWGMQVYSAHVTIPMSLLCRLLQRHEDTQIKAIKPALSNTKSNPFLEVQIGACFTSKDPPGLPALYLLVLLFTTLTILFRGFKMGAIPFTLKACVGCDGLEY